MLLTNFLLACANVDTTRLSSKGQIVLPKRLRQAHRWQPGQEFAVIETEEGILLRPTSPFPETTIDEVAACLRYQGRPRTLEEMEQAIEEGAKGTAHGRG